MGSRLEAFLKLVKQSLICRLFHMQLIERIKVGAVQMPWWFFVLLAVLLRWPSFFTAVIDHDESTYLIIASSLLKGQWLYDFLLDVKPPGIFLLFAGVLALWKSVITVRLLAALAIGFSGFFIYRSRKFHFGEQDAFAAFCGLAFVIAASVHRWEWSANTEIFFVLFSAWGLFVLQKGKALYRQLLFGFIMGIGLLFKYHVLFDFTAIWLMLNLKAPSSVFRWSFWRNGFFSLMAFLFPMMLFAAVYAMSGRWEEWIYVVIDIPSRYQTERNLAEAFSFMGAFYLSFLPLSLLFLYSLYLAFRKRDLKYLFQALLWNGMSWVAILLTGKSFYHYWYQALLPMLFFMLHPSISIAVRGSLLKLGRILLPISIVMVPLHMNFDLQKRNYHCEEIAAIIETDLDEDEVIFVDYKNVIYFLCDRTPVHRFPHTTLMHDSSHIKAFDIDVAREYEMIRAAAPAWMVLYGSGHPFLKRYTDSLYTAEAQFEEGVTVWKRISKAP